MKCPYCGVDRDRVIDSRGSGDAIRRRRECQGCDRRFTTYERVEEVPRLIFKKDKGREPFSRQKVLGGLLRACEKRPISFAELERVVDEVERRINERAESEIKSHVIGELVMGELRKLDQVAYVRFASVYREFADVTEFLQELSPLVKELEASSANRPTPELGPVEQDPAGEPSPPAGSTSAAPDQNRDGGARESGSEAS